MFWGRYLCLVSEDASSYLAGYCSTYRIGLSMENRDEVGESESSEQGDVGFNGCKKKGEDVGLGRC